MDGNLMVSGTIVDYLDKLYRFLSYVVTHLFGKGVRKKLCKARQQQKQNLNNSYLVSNITQNSNYHSVNVIRLRAFVQHLILLKLQRRR